MTAVIFDLDGTLADTLEDIGDTMNRTLTAMGYPSHDYDEYRFLVGNGLKNLAIRSLPASARSDANVEACHAAMSADYAAHYINKTHLYDGIATLLDGLEQRNIPKAILSNKADMITQKICRQLLSGWTFDVILGANERFPKKPNPEAALYVARTMNVAHNDVYYLGDSDVDMHTARAAGFFAVGVGWGFRPKDELIKAGAQTVIDRPEDFLKLII